MDRKIIKVAFDTEDYTKRVREGLVQWSYGHVLQVEGLEIPDGPIEVHFSLTDKNGEAPRQIGIVEGGVIAVAIPSFIFTPESVYDSKYEAYAFIYVTDEESGQTIRKIVFTIKSRPKPSDWIPPKSETTLGQVLEMINGKVDKSGHEPNKFLGTDKDGNVVVKDGSGGVSDEQVAKAVEDYLDENPIEVDNEIYYFNLNDIQTDSPSASIEVGKALRQAFNDGKRLVLVDTERGVYAPLMYTIPRGTESVLYFCGLYGGWSGQNRTLIRYSKNSSPAASTVTIDEYELTHPKIPTKLSELEDDITEGLKEEWKNDFVDWDSFFEYYDNELVTKEQLNQAISTIPKFDIKVVSELPTSNISSTTVYLLPSGEETNDIYTEYIYVNGKWEKLGTQRLDMSNYYTKEQIDTMFGTYVDEMAELLGGDA